MESVKMLKIETLNLTDSFSPCFQDPNQVLISMFTVFLSFIVSKNQVKVDFVVYYVEYIGPATRDQ